MTLNLFVTACVQGACAALLSQWRGLAPWWLAIQLLFPLALVLASSLHLPSWIFLLAFLFFLFLYWTTFRTQVPFYPSGPAVWAKVAELVPGERDISFVDIGSGLGGLPLHLARRFPGSRFVGVELAPLPWLISFLRARAGGSAARFHRHDYNDLHFAQYDIVFAYLSPAAMSDLWKKAKSEMRPGSMLISYEFAIPGIASSMTFSPRPHAAQLHIFHM
ncbi:MAG TPA: class I SAM-dependent methyltransferase [Oxalicibacterium sp.]|nr:class I SAM-dependent methyltransferase [Oxalicibacterium sp.]